MTINTKLKIGDKIYFIHEKKVIESEIRGIKIEAIPSGNVDKVLISVLYLCNNTERGLVNIKVYENDAYSSRAELIKSL